MRLEMLYDPSYIPRERMCRPDPVGAVRQQLGEELRITQLRRGGSLRKNRMLTLMEGVVKRDPSTWITDREAWAFFNEEFE